ncbi:MAG TPA: HAMP domain-containing histidine kinase, partial [Actinobacteria bacterium]|nr:HAMP domain-containing histidine kinase [Actinomycetota bacterium]
VSVHKSASGCRVEVQDEGPGITDADRERLFSYFGKLSNRPTGGEASTGLGMAISRRIVEAHGGEIGMDAAPGGGSIFWFTLP